MNKERTAAAIINLVRVSNKRRLSMREAIRGWRLLREFIPEVKEEIWLLMGALRDMRCPDPWVRFFAPTPRQWNAMRCAELHKALRYYGLNKGKPGKTVSVTRVGGSDKVIGFETYYYRDELVILVEHAETEEERSAWEAIEW